MNEKYTYAVARIKSRETSLLSNRDIEDLLLCKSYDACLDLLMNKGWTINEKTTDYQRILSWQMDEMWKFIGEIVADREEFNVLLYPIDFNNLKAAIKLFITDTENDELFSDGGTVSKDLIWNSVKEKNFDLLPESLKGVAKEAFEVLLHTKDPQACDAIVDAGLLRTIIEAEKLAKAKIISIYSESFVACANIKIAVRGSNMRKRKDFFSKALVSCDSLDVDRLSLAATKGIDEICDYLLNTEYADSVESIKKSMSDFERWCNDKILELVSGEKIDYFTIASIISYILNRQNEIRLVRMILAAKLVHVDEELIRKRLGRLYV